MTCLACRSAIIVLAISLAACAQGMPSPTPAEVQAGSVAAGAALFAGKTHFANGGPACIACHRAAGLPFPNGGTLGPNLTTAYTRMGAQGIDSILTTLYFPAMYPLYKTHQLTPQERADLTAFLQSSATQPQQSSTLAVFGLAALLFVIFMLIIGFAGRDRLLSVRRNLVTKARRQFEARPPAVPEPPETAGENR